jgi:hypothetical protein
LPYSDVHCFMTLINSTEKLAMVDN